MLVNVAFKQSAGLPAQDHTISNDTKIVSIMSFLFLFLDLQLFSKQSN